MKRCSPSAAATRCGPPGGVGGVAEWEGRVRTPRAETCGRGLRSRGKPNTNPNCAILCGRISGKKSEKESGR